MITNDPHHAPPRGKVGLLWAVLALFGAGLAPAAPAAARFAAHPNQACPRTAPPAEGMSAVERCRFAELDSRDAELNRVYRQVIRRLPSAQVHALRQSEREWIGQRETTCQARARHAPDENGAYLQCQIDETSARTQWLRSRYAGALR